MAAQYATIVITPGAAVALSNGPVAVMRIENFGTADIKLQATSANVAPPDGSTGVTLKVGMLLAEDLLLVDLFSGVGPGPYYIWGFANLTSTVAVSHA